MDMEEVFLNLGLDIIGLGVFNYEFNSMTKESPVIKARLCLASHVLGIPGHCCLCCRQLADANIT